MNRLSRRTFIGLAGAAVAFPPGGRAEGAATIATRFQPPAGFERAPIASASFAGWLRGLPLLPPDAPVLLHTGVRKPRQDVHAAVVDLDIGTRDLQQCADAVMRLRAEWLFSAGRAGDVSFNDTGGGKPMRFSAWARGERPRAEGRGLVWVRTAAPDTSYNAFRRYLDVVFAWAGTHSLERELVPAAALDIAAGDVVIKGGFPGHAVLVADVVVARQGQGKRVLLMQSYMPAQSIHVLKNLADPALSPWYDVREGSELVTPEWTFPAGSLKRWR